MAPRKKPNTPLDHERTRATAKCDKARGMRLGSLIAGVEAARSALTIANRSRDLLTTAQAELFNNASEALCSLEQLLWRTSLE